MQKVGGCVLSAVHGDCNADGTGGAAPPQLFCVRTEEDKRLNYLNYASATELGFSSLDMAEPGEVFHFFCFLDVASS